IVALQDGGGTDKNTYQHGNQRTPSEIADDFSAASRALDDTSATHRHDLWDNVEMGDSRLDAYRTQPINVLAANMAAAVAAAPEVAKLICWSFTLFLSPNTAPDRLFNFNPNDPRGGYYYNTYLQLAQAYGAP